MSPDRSYSTSPVSPGLTPAPTPLKEALQQGYHGLSSKKTIILSNFPQISFLIRETF